MLSAKVPKCSLEPCLRRIFGVEIKMASVQTLKELGEQMGLKGTELRQFIKEQQDLVREERNMLREEPPKTI